MKKLIVLVLLLLSFGLTFAPVQYLYEPLFQYHAKTHSFNKFWWADSGCYYWQYSASDTGDYGVVTLESEIISPNKMYDGLMQLFIEIIPDSGATPPDTLTVTNPSFTNTIYTHTFDTVKVLPYIRKYIQGSFTTKYVDFPISLYKYTDRATSVDTLVVASSRVLYTFVTDPALAFTDTTNATNTAGWQGETPPYEFSFILKTFMTDDSTSQLKVRSGYRLHYPYR